MLPAPLLDEIKTAAAVKEDVDDSIALDTDTTASVQPELQNIVSTLPVKRKKKRKLDTSETNPRASSPVALRDVFAKIVPAASAPEPKDIDEIDNIFGDFD